ncbi:histone H1-like [Pempheris klunzingeri]|uniref:histone H1-like n=1 Tax=Pempheris klunzingeri TaxID=3127111 RepID=UPI0039817638
MGPMVLFSILQDLTDKEFKAFLWHLKEPEVLGGYKPIKQCQLEKAERGETVDLMVKAYTLDGALKVTKKVLEKINRNDLVQTLPGTSSGPAADSTEVEMRDEAPAATTSSNLQAPLSRQEAPTLEEQIIAAVAESRERKGLSQPALKKILAAKGVDVVKSNKDINRVTLNLVREGTLTQTNNNGIIFFKLKAGAAKRATAAAKTAAKKAETAKKAAEKAAAVNKQATKEAETAKEAAAEAKTAAKKAAAALKTATKESTLKKEDAKKAADKAAAAEKNAAMKKVDAEEAAVAEILAMEEKEAAARKVEVIKMAAAAAKKPQ